MAGDSVDQQPWTGLPYPALAALLRQRVVHVQNALHGERSLRDLMHLADGPVLLASVHEKRADTDVSRLVLLVLLCNVGGDVRHTPDRAECDGVHPGRLGGLGLCCGPERPASTYRGESSESKGENSNKHVRKKTKAASPRPAIQRKWRLPKWVSDKEPYRAWFRRSREDFSVLGSFCRGSGRVRCQ